MSKSKIKEPTQNYVNRYQAKYKLLRTVYSPALKEKVHFTSEGFNHLMFKHGHRRLLKEIKYRLPLISLIISTIKRCRTVSKVVTAEETYKGTKINASYFELSEVVGDKYPAKIKVVIKRRGKVGKLVFQSVMKQKAPRNGRNLS